MICLNFVDFSQLFHCFVVIFLLGWAASLVFRLTTITCHASSMRLRIVTLVSVLYFLLVECQTHWLTDWVMQTPVCLGKVDAFQPVLMVNCPRWPLRSLPELHVSSATCGLDGGGQRPPRLRTTSSGPLDILTHNTTCTFTLVHVDTRCTCARLVAWHSGRTLVFDRQTFRPALDLQLTGDHLCG